MENRAIGAAVIADIVGSKHLTNRAEANRALKSAFATVNRLLRPVQPWTQTVGDEAQALYQTPASALRATLLLRLVLPASIQCRFGIGIGRYEVFEPHRDVVLQDGPAWWAARQSILQAKERESRRSPTLRTWYEVLERDIAAQQPPADLMNAYLLCRDQIVGDMSDRSRKLLFDLMLGKTQAAIARDQKISQAAVSQRLKNDGAHSVLASIELLEKGVLEWR